MKRINSDAVSPVVAVMLMLVVTIIIAAVVSAFAGGVAGSKDKSPSVSIRGTYSQTDGLKIENLGGNSISTMTTIVQILLSKSFGNAEQHVYAVNKSAITDVTGNCTDTSPYHCWLTPSGMGGINSFSGGDIAYIYPPYSTGPFLQPGESSTGSYWINNTANVGKTFWLEFADENGRIFARNEVTIQP